MAGKIVTIVGARPQFVKAAAVSRAFAQQSVLQEVLLHTGQHYDVNMSAIFFDELGIPPPALNLGIGGGSHGAMTGAMLSSIEAALTEIKPQGVLVYGDTNSTLAGALAAVKLHIPVAHAEAGLRSFNKRMPEEVNRVVADHVASLLLCPTRTAVSNLAREGIVDGVHLVGDVMLDATLFAIEQSRKKSKIVAKLGLAATPFVVCTVHRQENTDDAERFARLIRSIAAEAAAQGAKIVFPVHPRTRPLLKSVDTSAFVLTEPLGYLDMHQLLDACVLVLTDSGGLQKEAYFHRKPCITLRDETEWVETVDAGWNRLWTDQQWRKPRRDIADFGAGDAAKKTVEALSAAFAQ